MSEPRTAAGRRLLAEAPDWDYFGDKPWGSIADHVDAIEQEAAALDVGRLARALRVVAWGDYADEMADPLEVGDLSVSGYASAAELAAAIAREYEKLRTPEGEA